MFSWRIKRQVAVMAAVLVIAGGFILMLAGRLLPEASCTDGRRNQGETAVDCGGPCSACELRNPKPLAVFWARFGRAGDNAYDAAALVENPNQTLSSDLVRYEFTLLDQYGIIGQKTGAAYIYPGERLTIVEPNIRTSREPVRIEFAVKGVAWKSAIFTPPQLVVERREHRISAEGTNSQSVIEAHIFNTGAFHYRRMEITFAVFDIAGNLIGANRVLAENIAPRERRVVISVWPSVFAGTVARIEVYPRVNIFAPDAIIAP